MSTIERVAAKLRRLNPTDPSGQWSIYDLTLALPDLDRADIETAVQELCPDGGRYVGGVSRYLYHLMP